MPDLPLSAIIDGLLSDGSSADASANIQKFGTHSTLYPFTTENIGGYLQSVCRPGVKVLSVASSGDHLLNAIYLGARSVTVFDLNRLALLWCELKLQAALTLSYAEFRSFFYRSFSEEPLSSGIYLRLRKGLSAEAQQFFDELWSVFEFDGRKLRTSKVFRGQNDADSKALTNNPYQFSEAAFESLRAAIGKASINYVTCGVAQLSEHLANSRFDAILLSNISDYQAELGLGDDRMIETLDRFVREIIAPLLDHTERGGAICAAYLYCIGSASKSDGSPRSAIHVEALRRAAFKQLGRQLEEVEVTSFFPGERDLVYVVRLPD